SFARSINKIRAKGAFGIKNRPLQLARLTERSKKVTPSVVCAYRRDKMRVENKGIGSPVASMAAMGATRNFNTGWRQFREYPADIPRIEGHMRAAIPIAPRALYVAQRNADCRRQ